MGSHGILRAARRWRLLWSWLLLLPGCEALNQPTPLDRLFEPQRYAEPAPAPEPAPPAEPAAPPPPTVVAMEPIPDPPEAEPAESEAARLRRELRRNPWLTRFWSELTAAQQTRVERGLRRTAAPEEEPAGAWDSMGLADRARLVFGLVPTLERSAAAQ